MTRNLALSLCIFLLSLQALSSTTEMPCDPTACARAAETSVFQGIKNLCAGSCDAGPVECAQWASRPLSGLHFSDDQLVQLCSGGSVEVAKCAQKYIFMSYNAYNRNVAKADGWFMQYYNAFLVLLSAPFVKPRAIQACKST